MLKETLKRFTLKQVVIGRGHDGMGLVADVYLDKKKVAEFLDDGWGGEPEIRFETNEAKHKSKQVLSEAKFAEYIDEFPDVDYGYGLDFGFVNDPTSLVKVGIDESNIWLELLCYEPIDTAGALSSTMDGIGIEREIKITAESSDKYTGENKGTVEMVKELKSLGWTIEKVKKTKGLVFWIAEMKNKKIHIVLNRLGDFARKEQQNYKWRELNGVQINQPIDKWNHFWDGSRYGFMGLHSPVRKAFW